MRLLKVCYWFCVVVFALGAILPLPLGTRILEGIMFVLFLLPYLAIRYRREHPVMLKDGLYRAWLYRAWRGLWKIGVKISTPNRLATIVVVATVVISLEFSNIWLNALPVSYQAKVMLAFSVGFVSLFAAYAVLYDTSLLRKLLSYKNTEYYKQTNRPLSKVLRDKGQWGELLAFLKFDQLDCYKRFIINAVIPNTDGNGFTEIDMICITRTFIYVIEAKNRCGELKGNILEQDWMQYIGQQENPMQNPFIQNQNHIITLNSYLWLWAMAKKLNLVPEHDDMPEETMTITVPSQFQNCIFLGNYDSWITLEGELPVGMQITYPDGVVSAERQKLLKNQSNCVFSEEEVDKLAELLLPATKFSEDERRFMFNMREQLWQSAPSSHCVYFVEVEQCYKDFYCNLYRYDSHGIACLHDNGVWVPGSMLTISSSGWVHRLPDCQKNYRDLTSFEKAKELKIRLERYFSNNQNTGILYSHAQDGTLQNYLQKEVLGTNCPIYVEGQR